MRVARLTLLALSGAACCAMAASPPVDIPPRTSLIDVSSPDAGGNVRLTGRPGAVPPHYFVIAVTMDTGHFAHTKAADGSFQQSHHRRAVVTSRS